MYVIYHQGMNAWYRGMGGWSENAADAVRFKTASEAQTVANRVDPFALVTWID